MEQMGDGTGAAWYEREHLGLGLPCLPVVERSSGWRRSCKSCAKERVEMTRSTYEIPGQAGKLAVVTGASDGLGLQIATRLASAGADLVLPVRNPRKGEAAVERIRPAAPRARVTTTDLDLASLESVRALEV